MEVGPRSRLPWFVVLVLCACQADPPVIREQATEKLVKAVRDMSVAGVEKALTQGADPNHRFDFDKTHRSMTPLLFIARDEAARVEDGFDSLFAMISNKDDERVAMAKLLIAAGVDVRARDASGHTALDHLSNAKVLPGKKNTQQITHNGKTSRFVMEVNARLLSLVREADAARGRR